MSDKFKLPSSSKPTPIPQMREGVRGKLAIGILVVAGIVFAVLLLVFAFTEPSESKARNLMAVLTSVIGLLGFVLGFYFGKDSGDAA